MQIGDIVIEANQLRNSEVGVILNIDPERGDMALVYWSTYGDTMWHLMYNLRVINESR